MRTYRHITDTDRLEIEHSLRQGVALKKIAAKIGKHHTTVAREILARRVESDKGAFGRITNRCEKRASCGRTQLCMGRPDCTRRCPTCHLCNRVCPDFKEETCPKLAAAPYVCNGCKGESRCVLRKRYYIHGAAHKGYRSLLAESRSGANIAEGELLALGAALAAPVRQGQSIHHVMANNKDSFTVCEKTVYRYMHAGLLPSKRHDMPRVCRLRPRRAKPLEHKVDTTCRIGRTYADFLEFTAANPDLAVTEMDSVIGRVGGKAILTMKHRKSGLLLALLRDANDSQSVIDCVARLRGLAEPAPFGAAFPVLLADNGSEFSNPSAIEAAGTRMFYCDPCASWQKGAVERGNEDLRLILPKGRSFDGLTQEDIGLALSHINSYTRPGLGDRSPRELFAFSHGEGLLDALGIRKIPANTIILKPSLLA